MGDMADYALIDISVAEDLRHQHVLGELSMQDSYDHGFIDELGIEQNLGNAYDTAPTPWDIDNQLVIAVHEFDAATIEASNSEQLTKTDKTRQYLQGFVKFYKARGFLSVKQKSIIDTNFEGGSIAFIAAINKGKAK